MLAVGLVYVGLIAALLGGISLVKPLALVGIQSRLRGAFILALGLLIAGVGWAFPAKEVGVAVLRTQLDRFVPVYQFNEAHSMRVMAPKDRVYRAIKEVTADEILFFRTLTWVRRLGRPGPGSILNPSERLPLLEVATQTGFLLLAEEPDREIVVGTVVMAPRGWRPKKSPTAEDFKAIREPGFAIAAMNFPDRRCRPRHLHCHHGNAGVCDRRAGAAQICEVLASDLSGKCADPAHVASSSEATRRSVCLVSTARFQGHKHPRSAADS